MIGKNILVTGGSGLVGSNIPFGTKPQRRDLDLLSEMSITYYIRGKACPDGLNVDSLIHAAGMVGGVDANQKDQYGFFRNNAMMGLNVLDMLEDFTRFREATLLLSTCIFPTWAQNPIEMCDLHEGEPHPTNYGYAHAKRMLHIGAKALRERVAGVRDLKIRTITPCNLYGKGDYYNIDRGHVIPSLIHKCYLAKEQGTDFVVWGSGEAEREFMIASDLGKVLEMIHIHKVAVPDDMIVAPRESTTIRRVVDVIVAAMDYKGKVVYDASRPEGIKRKPTNTDDFHDFLERSSMVLTPLEDGIEQTVASFRKDYPNVRL
jgi:GDP-L-fucose synthase